VFCVIGFTLLLLAVGRALTVPSRPVIVAYCLLHATNILFEQMQSRMRRREKRARQQRREDRDAWRTDRNRSSSDMYTSERSVTTYYRTVRDATVGLKRGFQPTQRTQRKERNEMRSLLDRPITATTAYAAGTLPSCDRHARNY